MRTAGNIASLYSKGDLTIKGGTIGTLNVAAGSVAVGDSVSVDDSVSVTDAVIDVPLKCSESMSVTGNLEYGSDTVGNVPINVQKTTTISSSSVDLPVFCGTREFTIPKGGENRDIAVLFVDIRGLTTKAICAAKDIVDGARELEEKLMKEFGRSIGFGVGVNCGPAIVGNIGCEFRMDFTAIGDTVNTAARLEANAKRGQILISDAVYERVKDRIEVEEIGEIPLKGKSKGVFIYSVTKVNTESQVKH